VDFVDDVDLEAPPRRTDRDVLPQAADLVDATVAGGVDLDDIDVLSGGYFRAGIALIAGLGGRAGDAFERLGEDPRGARLADAAGAGEEVGVPDASRFDRTGEAAGDMFLTDEFVEPLRPVAAGDDPVGGGRTATGRRRAAVDDGVSWCGPGIGRR